MNEITATAMTPAAASTSVMPSIVNRGHPFEQLNTAAVGIASNPNTSADQVVEIPPGRAPPTERYRAQSQADSHPRRLRALFLIERMPPNRMQEQHQVKNRISQPREHDKHHVKDPQRQQPRREVGIGPRNPGHDPIREIASHDDSPTRSLWQLLHPKKIFQHHRIQRVVRLKRLDESRACPVIRRIKPQALAEMIHRLLAPALFQQRPSLVRMRKRIVRITRQRPLDRRAGFRFAPKFHQRHRAQVIAPGVLRVELQSGFRSLQRALPMLLLEFDAGAHAVVISVSRLQPNRFLDRRERFLLAIASGEHARQRIMRKRQVRRVPNRVARRRFRVIQPLLFEQTDRKQRMAKTIIRRLDQMLAQFLFGKVMPPLLMKHQRALQLR